jgi:hypothetical protein
LLPQVVARIHSNDCRAFLLVLGGAGPDLWRLALCY